MEPSPTPDELDDILNDIIVDTPDVPAIPTPSNPPVTEAPDPLEGIIDQILEGLGQPDTDIPEWDGGVNDGELDVLDNTLGGIGDSVLGGFGTEGGGIVGGISGAVGGGAGHAVGNALFGTDAENAYGATTGAILGSPFGPLGSFIGSAIGGLVDSLTGTSDQKNITTGVATTKPGDDLVNTTKTASGLELYTIARRVDNDFSNQYTEVLANVDKWLTEASKAAGFDISLDNNSFGDVAGSATVKNLQKNPTFFGSATEGSGESSKKEVSRNLEGGVSKFISTWMEAAKGQMDGDVQADLDNLLQRNQASPLSSEELVEGFRQVMSGNYTPWSPEQEFSDLIADFMANSGNTMILQ